MHYQYPPSRTRPRKTTGPITASSRTRSGKTTAPPQSTASHTVDEYDDPGLVVNANASNSLALSTSIAAIADPAITTKDFASVSSTSSPGPMIEQGILPLLSIIITKLNSHGKYFALIQFDAY